MICTYGKSIGLSPWLLLLLAIASTTVSAGTPTDIAISQTLTEGPAMTAYVAVTDEAGTAVTGIEASQIRGTVGSHVAEVKSLIPFANSGEGVAYIFLVDISRSLSGERFEQIKKALRSWIATLGTHDRVALLSFGTGVQTRLDFTRDIAALNAAIDGLALTDRQTFLHQALVRGMALGRQHAEGLPTRRVIVILTDGIDDAAGGVTEQEVSARMAEGPVPLYAIGFSSVHDRIKREAGLKLLGRFARQSGGMFVEAGRDDLATTYAAMKKRIHEVYRATLRCAACVLDGNRYRLQLSLVSAGLTLNDGVDVRLYPLPPQAVPEATPATGRAPATTTPTPATPANPPPSSINMGWWLYPVIGVSLILLIGGLMLYRRRKKPTTTEPPLKPEESANHSPPPLADSITIAPAMAAPTVAAAPESPRSPAGRRVRLVFMNTQRRGDEVSLVLAPTAILGRSASCALVISGDEEVSSSHARLMADGRRVVLEDLGSTNGTWLNGVAIRAPTPVTAGDVLKLGRAELRFDP
ncbi:MAG: VWA domain-containing protein [Pseudomonadota bacterium]